MSGSSLKTDHPGATGPLCPGNLITLFAWVPGLILLVIYSLVRLFFCFYTPDTIPDHLSSGPCRLGSPGPSSPGPGPPSDLSLGLLGPGPHGLFCCCPFMLGIINLVFWPL